MDADDSEKRIADLEHQLADGRRGTDLPSASPDVAPTSARFLAFAAPAGSGRMVAFVFGMWAVSMLLPVAVHAVVPHTYANASLAISIGIWAVGGCVLYFGFPDLVGRAPRRNIVISVTGDQLTITPNRGKVLSFGDAQLGPWDFWSGMRAGTALHLWRDAQSFVLGGRDHRMAARTGREAPPTNSVQAWMWPEDFEALLAMIGPRYWPDARTPEPEVPTRCLLIPRSAYGFSASLPSPRIAVDVGRDAISVIHLNNSASVGSARLGQVRAQAAHWIFREGEKGSRFPRVALVLRIPDMEMLSIGCPVARGLGWGRVPRESSDRFAWRVGTLDWQEPPAYWVSAADWLTLVETFGLTSKLEDRARR
ncbi:hypothetical protein GGC64_002582 [Mycobacterium sp. OAS707]|uniref:hypothetical protein n=1 Tax=Mycobacterium sp. OAS707 TaxID=2663822 RepID=UPI00178ACDE9|nr:hypothetical protein [Mycobacterium sp. OAS707]MBE1548558.1 hypothetical protein [Mycobacterium sp. OAS707]